MSYLIPLENGIYFCKSKEKCYHSQWTAYEVIIYDLHTLESISTIFYLMKCFFHQQHLICALLASISQECVCTCVLVQEIPLKISRSEKSKVLRKNEKKWLLYPAVSFPSSNRNELDSERFFWTRKLKHYTNYVGYNEGLLKKKHGNSCISFNLTFNICLVFSNSSCYTKVP